MVCRRHWFYDLHDVTDSANFFSGDDSSHKIKRCCNICVQFPNGCVKKIENMMFVPRIKKNSISISTIVNQ